MSPEQIERMNAGALEDEIQEDVDEVAEALAVHSIISEERHEEILSGVAECQNRLDALSTQIQTAPAESPLLNRLMEEMLALKADIASLKSSMEQIRLTPLQSASEPVEVTIVEPDGAPRAEELTVEQEPVVPASESPTPEPETPKRRHRVL